MSNLLAISRRRDRPGLAVERGDEVVMSGSKVSGLLTRAGGSDFYQVLD